MHFSLLLFALSYVSGIQHFGIIEPIKMDPPDLPLVQSNQTTEPIKMDQPDLPLLQSNQTSTNMLDSGFTYYIRVSNANLYWHAWGSNKGEGTYIRLHGNKTYAQTNWDSTSFKIESAPDATHYIIKPAGYYQYLHSWGSSNDGAHIRMHNDKSYADSTSSSQFEFEFFNGNQQDVIIKVKPSEQYLHIWGGSKDGKYLRLHNNRAYAMSHANSKFVLEPACNLVSVAVNTPNVSSITQKVISAQAFSNCGGSGTLTNTYTVSSSTHTTAEESVTLSESTNWNVEGSLSVTGGGNVFGVGVEATATITAGGGGSTTSEKTGSTAIGTILTNSSSTTVNTASNTVELYFVHLTNTDYPSQTVNAQFYYNCPNTASLLSQSGTVQYQAQGKATLAHTQRFASPAFATFDQCITAAHCVLNINSGGTFTDLTSQWSNCMSR